VIVPSRVQKEPEVVWIESAGRARIAPTMRISYDSEVDALYIRFIETTVTTKHVADGIAVDYADDGRIAGIEVLDARKRFGNEQILRRVVLEDLVPTPAVSRSPSLDARQSSFGNRITAKLAKSVKVCVG
jgi:uncharacterized protein YuzE